MKLLHRLTRNRFPSPSTPTVARSSFPTASALVDDLGDQSPRVRHEAAKMLRELREPAVDALLEPGRGLQHPTNPVTRRNAARVLSRVGGSRAIGPLGAALMDPDRDVVAAAIEGLGILGDHSATEVLRAFADSTRGETLQGMARAAAERGEKRARESDHYREAQERNAQREQIEKPIRDARERDIKLLEVDPSPEHFATVLARLAVADQTPKMVLKTGLFGAYETFDGGSRCPPRTLEAMAKSLRQWREACAPLGLAASLGSSVLELTETVPGSRGAWRIAVVWRSGEDEFRGFTYSHVMGEDGDDRVEGQL